MATDANITICLLKTEDMVGPPDGLAVTKFGHEMLVNENGTVMARGTPMMVHGPKDLIQKWLTPYDGVWVTHNPMLGDWEVVHVTDVS
jgi:hypothetical protein